MKPRPKGCRTGEIHKKPDAAARLRMSLGQQGKLMPKRTPEQVERLRQSQLKIRDIFSQKSLEQWADPLMREKMVKAILKGSHNRPTIAEKKVWALLNYICPNDYKYTGNDGSSVINGCIPDFLNINGQKKIVEVFGDYWHSEEVTGRTKEEEEQRKIERFRVFGFKCLIIWESELGNPDEVIEKLREFVK